MIFCGHAANVRDVSEEGHASNSSCLLNLDFLKNVKIIGKLGKHMTIRN